MTSAVVAVKYIQIPPNDTHYLKKLIGEIVTLKKLSAIQHNIYTTKLLDLVIPEVADGSQLEYLFIVLEYVPADLETLISYGSGKNVPE